MQWCPKCKVEYREGFTQCSDCGEQLVHLDDPVKTEDVLYSMEPYKLVSVSNYTEASMIGARLQDAGIPFITKDHGPGGYMKIYMGYSVYGEDIYVDKNDLEKAKELLDYYFKENEDNFDIEDVDTEDVSTEDISNDNYELEEANNNNFNKATKASNDSEDDTPSYVYYKRRRAVRLIIIINILLSVFALLITKIK